jgi:hypothetical protein
VIEEAIEERNNADKSFIRTTGLFLMFLIRVGFGNQTAGRPAGRFPAGRNGGFEKPLEGPQIVISRRLLQ